MLDFIISNVNTRRICEMKEKFVEYYKYSDEDFDTLWNKGLFIFDANALLNFYRYSQKASESYFELLEKISDRIWLPHQFAQEYFDNRLEVIWESRDDCKKNINSLKKSLGWIMDKRISGEIDGKLQEIDQAITSYEGTSPNEFEQDKILDKLTKLFENRVGEPYNSDNLEQIYEKGKERYDKHIPPGYMDSNKDNRDKTKTKKYGDFIAWCQIIDKAKTSDSPVILVTNEKKEDWWVVLHGKIVGPRVELIKEIRSKANVLFYMYSSERFLEFGGKHFGQPIEEELILEVKGITDEEMKKGLFWRPVEVSGEVVMAQPVVYPAANISRPIGRLDEEIDEHGASRLRLYLSPNQTWPYGAIRSGIPSGTYYAEREDIEEIEETKKPKGKKSPRIDLSDKR